MAKWEDETRSGEIIGASVKIGDSRLSVHHYMGCGDLWFVSFYGMFDKKELAPATLEGAKSDALEMLKDKLTIYRAEIMMLEGRG